MLLSLCLIALVTSAMSAEVVPDQHDGATTLETGADGQVAEVVPAEACAYLTPQAYRMR